MARHRAGGSSPRATRRLYWRARHRRFRRRASFFDRRQVRCHSAHVAFRARVRYAWHPEYEREIEVLYREERNGEEVFICVLPDGSGQVVPTWMFDGARCVGMRVGAPRASASALEQLRVLLRELGFDSESAADVGRPQEVQDEAEAKSRDEASEAVVARADCRPTGGRAESRSRHCGARTHAARSGRHSGGEGSQS